MRHWRDSYECTRAHLTMDISGIWVLYHQMRSMWNTWKTSAFIISISPDLKTFIGEVRIDNQVSGSLRLQISGSLHGGKIRWWLPGLEYRGILHDGGMRIKTGQIFCIGCSLVPSACFGTFFAVRVQERAGQFKSPWQTGCLRSTSRFCRVTDAMLDTLDRSGASIEILRPWQAREAAVMDTLLCAQPLLPPHIRSPLIRQIQRILTVTGAEDKWYSAVSLLDQCASCCTCNNFVEHLPLTSMAILHLVESIDSAKKKGR